MVIINAENPIGNILHVIIGDETNDGLDIQGACIFNITPLLNMMKPEKPVFIHLTRCGDEAAVVANIQQMIEAGVPYPFSMPNIVFFANGKGMPGHADGASGMQPYPGTPAEAMAAAAKAAATKPTPVAKHSGKCTLCSDDKKELVPKISPHICYDCIKLERDLAIQRKAPVLPIMPIKPNTPSPNTKRKPPRQTEGDSHAATV